MNFAVVRKWINNRPLFFRLVIPYIAVVILLASCLGFTYSKSLKIVKKDILYANDMALEQTRRTLEIRISEMEQTMWDIVSLPSVRRALIIREPFEKANPYRFKSVSSSLKQLSLSNDFILDYFVLFKRSSMAVNSDKIYTFLQLYELYFQYDEGSRDHWQNRFFQLNGNFQPAMQLTLAGKSVSGIPFIRPMGNGREVHGALLVLMDNRKIHELLGSMQLSEGSLSYIADQKGQIISYVSGTGVEGLVPSVVKDVNLKDMITASTTSHQLGWTFVTAHPQAIVAERSLEITQSILYVLLIFVFLGLVISIGLAHRHSLSLLRLTRHFTEQSEPKLFFGNAYSWIEQKVGGLSERQHIMEKLHKEQLPILQTTFYEQLLKGYFSSEDHLQSLMKHAGLEFDSTGYLVITIHFTGYGDGVDADILREVEGKKIIVKEALRFSDAAKSIHVHDWDTYHLSIIYCCGDEEIQDLRLVEQILLHILGNHSLYLEEELDVVVTASSMVTNLWELPHAYQEAMTAFRQYVWDPRHRFVWYDGQPENQSFAYYPPELEAMLVQCTLTGDIERMQDLLHGLHQENMANRKLSLSMLQLFLNELLGTLAKVLIELKNMQTSPEEYVQIRCVKDAVDYYGQIHDRFLSLGSLIHLNKRSHNIELRDRLTTFIQKNAFDSDLSASMVAREFNISSAYFSQFFKEQVGSNFSTYLEQLRIARAKELLNGTDSNVQEIAVSIGYNSSNSFIRAFKRSEGRTPSEYRQA